MFKTILNNTLGTVADSLDRAVNELYNHKHELESAKEIISRGGFNDTFTETEIGQMYGQIALILEHIDITIRYIHSSKSVLLRQSQYSQNKGMKHLLDDINNLIKRDIKPVKDNYSKMCVKYVKTKEN